MKNLFRFLILMTFFFTTTKLSLAQWVQVLNTDYPQGCVVTCLTFNDTKLFAGINDYINYNNGGMFLSSNDGIDWLVVSSDLVNKNINAFTACPDGIGGTSLFAGVVSFTGEGGAYRSTDNGISWIKTINGMDIGSSVNSFAVMQNGSGGTYLFACTNYAQVFRSSNNGENWDLLKNGFWINSFEVSLDGTKLFGAGDSGAYLSTDYGANWISISDGLTNTSLNSIVRSRDGNNLFVGTNGSGVFRSTDNGLSWFPANNGIAGFTIHKLACGLSGEIFAAAREGIFISKDNGTSWYNAGLGYTEGAVFSIGMNDQYVYIGTHNGNVWRRPLSEFIYYTISTSSNPSNGGLTFGGGIYDSGSSVMVKAKPSMGYIFANWTENGVVESTSPDYIFTLSNNRTLIANFVAQQFDVTTSANPRARGRTSGGGTYDSGSSVTVTASPYSGYTFTNWTENGNEVSTNSTYTFTLIGNRTLVANFDAPQYTVTTSCNPSDKGTVVGGGSNYLGSTVTLTATPESGYIFNNWTENGNIVSTSGNYIFAMNGNRNLVANFSIGTVQTNATVIWPLTANHNAVVFGNLEADSLRGNVLVTRDYNLASMGGPLGTSQARWWLGGADWPISTGQENNLYIDFVVSPKPGYNFKVDSVKCSFGGDGTNFMRANLYYGGSDTSLTSLNLLNATPYSLKQASYYTSGTPSDTNVIYSIGREVQDGEKFRLRVYAYYTYPNPSYAKYLSTQNICIFGRTTQTSSTQYIVQLSSNPANSGSTNGAGTYDSGSNVTVTATPNNGFAFTNWTENGSIVSSIASYTYTINGNRTLVANFAEVNNSALLNGISGGSLIRVTDDNPVNPSANPNAYKINGTAITVEAWVYPLSYPDPQFGNTIFTRALNTTSANPWQSYRLWISNSNGFAQPAFSISSGTPGSEVTILSPDVLPTFQWTHLAGTFDGSSLKIYINGVLKSTVQTNITINSVPGVGLYIGRFIKDRLKGAVDDVRLWNICRSETEIVSNMLRELQGDESGLAGYWNLNFTSSLNQKNIVSDRTLNHNDLEVLNLTKIINFNPLTIYSVPTYNLSPTSINLGTLEQNSQSPIQTITLTNTGTNPLIGQIVNVSNNNIIALDMTTINSPFFIGSGQISNFSYSYIPMVSGALNETFQVQTNALTQSEILVSCNSIPQVSFDINNISMWICRNGNFATKGSSSSSPGLEWPKGSGKNAVYTSGIWIGAEVEGSVRTATSFYRSEFAPGPIASDPNDLRYRVYKIQNGDNAGNNPDYADWPATLGAPVNTDGSPQIIGEQTLFSVYNDLDEANHFLGSQPLGAEVQQTVFGFNQSGTLSNTVFLRFKIINKSSNTWNNTYISLWSDPDLGNPSDDLIGIDTTKNLGFVYNGSNEDQIYGTSPPSAGYQILKGAFFTKPIQAFSYFTNGAPPPKLDPKTSLEAYNFMKGKWSDGSSYIDPITNLPTNFALAGDPVNNHGWVDSKPADRRFLFSTGPLTMEPGQSKEIIAAIILGQGSSNLNSITVLKSAADEIQNLFDSGQIFGGALENVATVTVPEGMTNSLNDISNSGAQITVTSGTGGATVEAASYVAPPPGVQTITTPSIASVGKYLEVDVQGTVSWPIPIRIYYTRNDLLQVGIVESDLQGIFYWQGLTNQWKLYSNSGSDDQGRGPSTTWVDTTNVKINGVNYEGFAAADAYHLTQMILAAKKKSITERYNFATQFIQSLPDEAFKKPADTRRKQLVKMLDQSKSKYDSGNLKSAAQYLEQNVLNHLISNNKSGNDLWVTDATMCKTLIRMINEIIDVLLRPQTLGKNVEGNMNVVDHVEIPTEYGLSQNYPNPFNPITRIQFGLPENVHTKLIIYDVLGREIVTLLDSDLSAGYHEVEFNGSNLPSGIYIYRIQAGEFTSVKKMILIK